MPPLLPALLAVAGAFVLSTFGVVASMFVVHSFMVGEPPSMLLAYLRYPGLHLSLAREVAPYTFGASALFVCLAYGYRQRAQSTRTRVESAVLSASAFGSVVLGSAAASPAAAFSEFASVLGMAVGGLVLGAGVGALLHPMLGRVAGPAQ